MSRRQRPESAAPDGDLVVVVVLGFNKREDVLRCLTSVERQTYGPREVVMVDNGSTDGTSEAVARAHPGVHLVRSPANLGASGGRNLGIRYAERFPYSYLLFLDDDTAAEERMIEELVAALHADPLAGLATPKAYRAGSPGTIASAGGMHVRLGRGNIVDVGRGQEDTGQFERSTLVDSCVGFAVLVRRQVLDATGGFDEAFNPYGWEEVDFSLRARSAGYMIRYAPRAVVYHAGGTPGRGRRLPEYERGKFANFVRLMRRHATPLQWAGFLAVLPARGVLLTLDQVRRGNWRIVGARLAGVAHGATTWFRRPGAR
jgi:GT2 family glycosyltransferase